MSKKLRIVKGSNKKKTIINYSMLGIKLAVIFLTLVVLLELGALLCLKS